MFANPLILARVLMKYGVLTEKVLLKNHMFKHKCDYRYNKIFGKVRETAQ